ncbi:hypothetical protein L195_g045526, partial [Trifolium pratense]
DTNSGSDKLHPDVRPYAMMTRTGYMEFDPMQARGKLPEIYARCIGQYMGDSVFLQDINKNQIQVAEITYPNRNPPYRLMLDEGFQHSSLTGPIPFFVLPPVFSHMLEKTLTVSDVETGYLTLFWKGFCEDALPAEETQLTLIDWIGNTWTECDYKFQDTTHTTCKISGQWHNICKVHRLAKDMIIKLGVTGAANNRIIYFKLSPYLGVRTTLYAPTTSNTYKRIYQSQHFYML